MPPDLSHLLDPDPNAMPDLPRPGVLPERFDLAAGGGIRVSQNDSGAIISAPDNELPVQQSGGSVTFREFIDPLKFVSFRATLTGGNANVSIVTSYVNSVYYDVNQWKFESFKIEPEVLPIGVFPQFLYLKLPVRFFGGLGIVPATSTPRQNFTSGEVRVNSLIYFFNTIQTTGYISRNRTVTPDSYYVLRETEAPVDTLTALGDATGGATGFWHFLLGTATAGGFQQINLGVKTLPQPMTFNIVSLNVT